MTGIDLHEAPGAEHLRGQQSNSAIPPHHLPKGIVGKTSHRGLENRRSDDEWADF